MPNQRSWGKRIIFPSFSAHFPDQNFIGTSDQFSIGGNSKK
jgi:hypothetical protein